MNKFQSPLIGASVMTMAVDKRAQNGERFQSPLIGASVMTDLRSFQGNRYQRVSIPSDRGFCNDTHAVADGSISLDSFNPL